MSHVTEPCARGAMRRHRQERTGIANALKDGIQVSEPILKRDHAGIRRNERDEPVEGGKRIVRLYAYENVSRPGHTLRIRRGG